MLNKLTKIIGVLVCLLSLKANSFDLIKPKYESSPLTTNEFSQLRIKQGWVSNAVALKVHNGLNAAVLSDTLTIFQIIFQNITKFKTLI